MRTIGVIIAIVIVMLIIGAIFGVTYVSAYNGLVKRQENVNQGRSRFAAALNTCTQKMKAVWTMADQEGTLEKETYVAIAKARAGYDEANKEVDAAQKPQGSVLDLTKAGADLGRALVNVRVAFEAYPTLKTSEVYQKAMVAVEEGYNEIKTSLDDWISVCRDYNTYRRSFVTNFFANTFFGDKFPERIAYYEGGIKEPEQMKIPAEDLNPKAR